MPLDIVCKKKLLFFPKTQLPRQPLTRVMQGCLFSQVARRPSYKGAASTKVHLPMDSATVIGLVAIFGSILPAQGLTPSALKTCTTCFDALQSVACISQNLVLIPELPRMILPVEKNKVKMSALRSALKTLDLKPDRPVIQTPFLRECITRFQVQTIQASKQVQCAARFVCVIVLMLHSFPLTSILAGPSHSPLMQAAQKAT